MAIKDFFKKAFGDMKASAKAQREVDKAEFAQKKAEARATFEENKGRNTLARAKRDAKKSWDDAHMSPDQRAAKAQDGRNARIAAAKNATEAANARYDAAKKK